MTLGEQRLMADGRDGVTRLTAKTENEAEQLSHPIPRQQIAANIFAGLFERA